jgi:dinuclear metal center YbgI/SA1388 family protein
MKITEVTKLLENRFPLSLQESYDNSGLIIGDSSWEINAALITVDITEDIIDEAIQKKASLIIAHHPIIFNGIKKINGKNWIERSIIKAIKNNIAIYAIHTNFDNLIDGTNQYLAKKLNLNNQKTLRPIKGNLLKLVVYCPSDYAEKVREALFEAGAGQIGNYENCSFNIDGMGSFKAEKNANPFVGKIGQLHYEKETRIETILPKHNKNQVLAALLNSHPYEEVAYDLYALENGFTQSGAGIIGDLTTPVDAEIFLKNIKDITGSQCIRHTKIKKEKIKKIAICGGSGAFLISDAKSALADIYLTGDIKYHEFFEADDKMIIADIGHYESEQFTKEILYEILKENFPTFAFLKSDINTNPINYL